VDAEHSANSSFAALVSNVPPGSASRPIPRLLYRLSAPLRWWRRSIVRIMAGEVYRLFLRMKVILRTPSLRLGPSLPLSPKGHSLENFGSGSNFLRACSESMLCLRKESSWIGNLDLQMAAQAFRQGASWAIDNACSEKRSENTPDATSSPTASLPPSPRSVHASWD
jgi:hypothetical protein